MAFKQNLPAVAVTALAVLLAVAALLGVAFFGPTDEDRLRQAALRHAQALGATREPELFGTVADIPLPDGSVRHVAFGKREGAWAVVEEDLFEDFREYMATPEAQARVLGGLRERIVQRFRQEPEFKEGISHRYTVAREGDALVAVVRVVFRYPEGFPVESGLYQERFRYGPEGWTSGAAGSLFDRMPGR